MSLKEATLAAAIGKLLKEKIDEADKAGRADTLKQLIAAKDALGVKTVDITLPDGTKIGRATLPTPSPGVDVDHDAFLKWVRAEHPTEVVDAVRESFRKSVMARLKVVGGDVVDKTTGEAVDWASVRDAAAEPTSFTVTFEGDGRMAIEEAWRSGLLDPLEHLTRALPGGAL